MRESLWNGRWITPLGRMGAFKMSGEELPLEVHYTHKIRPKNLYETQLTKHSDKVSLLSKFNV